MVELICPDCGIWPNASGWNYCPYCGAILIEVEDVQE